MANRADQKSRAAQKKLVLADTTLLAEVREPKEEVESGNAMELGLTFKTFLNRFILNHNMLTLNFNM